MSSQGVIQSPGCAVQSLACFSTGRPRLFLEVPLDEKKRFGANVDSREHGGVCGWLGRVHFAFQEMRFLRQLASSIFLLAAGTVLEENFTILHRQLLPPPTHEGATTRAKYRSTPDVRGRAA